MGQSLACVWRPGKAYHGSGSSLPGRAGISVCRLRKCLSLSANLLNMLRFVLISLIWAHKAVAQLRAEVSHLAARAMKALLPVIAEMGRRREFEPDERVGEATSVARPTDEADEADEVADFDPLRDLILKSVPVDRDLDLAE